MFNGTKCMLVIYKSPYGRLPNQNIYVNNVKMPRISEVIHLNHFLSEDIYYKFDVSKYMIDFNSVINIFFFNFKYTTYNIRNVLFHLCIYLFIYLHCLL